MKSLMSDASGLRWWPDQIGMIILVKLRHFFEILNIGLSIDLLHMCSVMWAASVPEDSDFPANHSEWRGLQLRRVVNPCARLQFCFASAPPPAYLLRTGLLALRGHMHTQFCLRLAYAKGIDMLYHDCFCSLPIIQHPLPQQLPQLLCTTGFGQSQAHNSTISLQATQKNEEGFNLHQSVLDSFHLRIGHPITAHCKVQNGSHIGAINALWKLVRQ